MTGEAEEKGITEIGAKKEQTTTADVAAQLLDTRESQLDALRDIAEQLKELNKNLMSVTVIMVHKHQIQQNLN